MADKVGESILTALEDRPVNISVEAKKKTPTKSSTSATTSHFSPLEDVLLAGTDPGTADNPKGEEERLEEACKRFASLGLGRGVDATRSKPWLEKTSFQVRWLRDEGEGDKLTGTEWGGAVEAYEYQAWSEHKLQTELQHSVAVSSAPVSIGLDADHSRTSTYSRHVVGRRVHNRTISFREDLDEIPSEGGCTQPLTPNATPSAVEEGSPPKCKKEGRTFEEKLTKWVLEQLHRDAKSDSPLDGHMKAIQNGASPVVKFKEWFEHVPPNEHTNANQQMYKLCHDFVSFFHVTHYVSALELGALEYSVMTEEDYLRQVGAEGSFGLDKIVSTTLKSKSSYSLHKTRKYSQLKRVGLIKNPEGGEYYVPRGTYAEAVIGAELKPIHWLIRHEELRRSLQRAVLYYIEEVDRNDGPFLIASDSINRDRVYLSVRERDMSLQATTDKEKASEFFVVMTEEGSNVYEFHIVYKGKSETANKGLSPQPTLASPGHSQHQPPHHYLSTPLFITGTNSGPLHFELNPKKHHTMFVLHSRLRTRGAPAEVLGPWVQGREGYFINCYGRKFAWDGYLAVQRFMDGDVVRYRPLCVPSRRATEDYFKVFYLMRPSTVVELKSANKMVAEDSL